MCASPERTPGWGYDRIVGALANLGHAVSDQTVGNILRRYGSSRRLSGARIPPGRISLPPAWPSWQVPTSSPLKCSLGESRHLLRLVLFIHLESRRVSLAGLTKHPTAEWMIQMARNATDESSGFLRGMRYLLHDRDTKFGAASLDLLRSSGIRRVVKKLT